MTGRPIEGLKITGNSDDGGVEELEVTAFFEKYVYASSLSYHVFIIKADRCISGSRTS